MINVIFLDIDGVLNAQFSKNREYTQEERFGLCQDHVDNLKKILDEVPNCRIVISSTWRRFRTHDLVMNDKYNWRTVLEAMLHTKDVIYGDIGTTNEDTRSSDGRALDIKAWLDANRHLGIGTFVIIDDECSGLRKHFPNNVVDCEIQSYNGLTEKKAKEAIWILTNFGTDKSMDNVFITSDTHFYHENIIKYCNRPFANKEEMNAELIRRWNATVPKDALVWHLGDFCFGKKENIQEILSKLNGKINLVLGNHDHRKFQFYYDVGFHRVYDRPVTINNFYMLSHAPAQWITDNSQCFNLFGHVHQTSIVKNITSRTYNCCVEVNDYRPVLFSEIIKRMREFDESK